MARQAARGHYERPSWKWKPFYNIRTYMNTKNLENIRTCVIWVKNIRTYVAAPPETVKVFQFEIDRIV